MQFYSAMDYLKTKIGSGGEILYNDQMSFEKRMQMKLNFV